MTGSYKAPRQFTWFTGVVLLVVTLFLSFSGYLLPWDQLAFWAVTIGTSMAKRCRRPSSVNGQSPGPWRPRHRRQRSVAFLPVARALLAFGALPLLLRALLQGRALRHQLAGP
ncbi:MAG: cytochrome b N-terminal domain-containing protein [Caldilineaceae bacterium]